MRIDLHVHTIYSDGIITPEMATRLIKRRGLDGIAITDHNTTKGWGRAVAEGKKLGIEVVHGEEIKIKEKGWKIGEILCLFTNEEIGGPRQIYEVQEIIDEVKRQDGFVIIPHPFDYWIIRNGLSSKTKLLDLFEKGQLKIDGIEVLNSKSVFIGNSKSAHYAKRTKLLSVAGSDAHCPPEVGLCYTQAKASSLEEFRHVLKQKKVTCHGKSQSFLRKIANSIYESAWRIPSQWQR